MSYDPWKTDSNMIGVLAGGTTINGIFTPDFFQMGFLEGNPEEDLKDYFDFGEEERNDSRTL